MGIYFNPISLNVFWHGTACPGTLNPRLSGCKEWVRTIWPKWYPSGPSGKGTWSIGGNCHIYLKNLMRSCYCAWFAVLCDPLKVKSVSWSTGWHPIYLPSVPDNEGEAEMFAANILPASSCKTISTQCNIRYSALLTPSLSQQFFWVSWGLSLFHKPSWAQPLICERLVFALQLGHQPFLMAGSWNTDVSMPSGHLLNV